MIVVVVVIGIIVGWLCVENLCLCDVEVVGFVEYVVD